MKHTLTIDGCGTLKVSSLTPERVTHALRLRAGKKIGPSIEQLETGLDLRTCAFCGRTCRHYTFTFLADFSKITGVQYQDDLNYCRQTGCPGKALNPNSVDFVSVSRGLTREAALRYIKSRNKSPFYAENHASKEDYSSFQGVLSRLPAERVADILKRQNHSRSLDAYQTKWGNEEGTKRWHLVQSSKAITPERMVLKHGAQGLERYEQWKKDASCTLDNFIRRHGKDEGLRRYRSWVSKVTRSTGYGIRTKIDGMNLYSLFELRFYQALQAVGFDGPMKHDAFYPDSAWRSDFYFPVIDRHLEVAGMVGDSAYDARLAQKIERYNCLVVQRPEECDTMAQHIKDLHDQL